MFMFRSNEGVETEDSEKSSGPYHTSPNTGEDSIKMKVNTCTEVIHIYTCKQYSIKKKKVIYYQFKICEKFN